MYSCGKHKPVYCWNTKLLYVYSALLVFVYMNYTSRFHAFYHVFIKHGVFALNYIMLLPTHTADDLCDGVELHSYYPKGCLFIYKLSHIVQESDII